MLKMITSDETEKILELRSVLPSDLLTKDRYGDNHFLIRWLRARNMDVQKAAEMLEKSMQWRKENGADEVIPKGLEVPMKYRKIYPTAILGRDDEDCLVLLLPLGRFNHRILMENEGMETALRYNMIWMERMMNYLKQCEEETGKKGLKIVEVVDMEYYSYRELTYGPAREFILQTNRVFDENYPELLKSCIIINAPKIFTMLWNMIKPFMSKATVSKVQIYGGGLEEETWKEFLKTKLKPDAVPKRWGGTKEESDEFCSQDKSVWIDAPIPLSYFTHGEVNLDGLKTGKVRARDTLVVEFPVNIHESEISPDSQQKLLWKIKVDSHDIGFSVKFKPTNSTTGKDMHIVYPECRIDSKQGLREGSLEISKSRSAGIYNLVFDNRHSYTRSKTVHFSIQVLQDTETVVDAIKADKDDKDWDVQKGNHQNDDKK